MICASFFIFTDKNEIKLKGHRPAWQRRMTSFNIRVDGYFANLAELYLLYPFAKQVSHYETDCYAFTDSHATIPEDFDFGKHLMWDEVIGGTTYHYAIPLPGDLLRANAEVQEACREIFAGFMRLQRAMVARETPAAKFAQNLGAEKYRKAFDDLERDCDLANLAHIKQALEKTRLVMNNLWFDLTTFKKIKPEVDATRNAFDHLTARRHERYGVGPQKAEVVNVNPDNCGTA